MCNVFVRRVVMPLADRFPSGKGEVGFKDGRLHSLGHFFCSWCSSEGISEQVVMRWLGHTDSKMAQHYFHLPNGEARRLMVRLRLYGNRAGE